MGRTLNLKNVLYFSSINCIGGIETFCCEFGLKYGKDYDVTLVYNTGDAAMLRKIAGVMRVIKLRPGDTINCDVFMFGFDHAILDRVNAKRYVQTLHADYVMRHLTPCLDARVTDRIGVSKRVSESVREHFGLEAETLYNPYTPKKPRKVLKLISATRLTAEKGYNRMVAFADALDAANVLFRWDIYTDSPKQPFNKSVAFLPPRLDVVDLVADADYLVQLSDTEGYSYSVIEALSIGTPVIVTALPIIEEQGVEDRVNAFVLPFDMSDIPVKDICKGLKPFKYTPHESSYDKLLVKGKAQYEDDKGGKVDIRCKKRYFDIELDREQLPGAEQTVSWERAEKLVSLGVVEIV